MEVVAIILAILISPIVFIVWFLHKIRILLVVLLLLTMFDDPSKRIANVYYNFRKDQIESANEEWRKDMRERQIKLQKIKENNNLDREKNHTWHDKNLI